MFDYKKREQLKIALAFCQECLGWRNAKIVSEDRIADEPPDGVRTYFAPTNISEVMDAAQAFWHKRNLYAHMTYHRGTSRVWIHEPDADDPKFETLGHGVDEDLAAAILSACVAAKRKQEVES